MNVFTYKPNLYPDLYPEMHSSAKIMVPGFSLQLCKRLKGKKGRGGGGGEDREGKTEAY